MRINLSGLSAEILKAPSVEYSDKMNVKTLLQVLQSKSEILSNSKLYVAINDELANEEESFKKDDKVLVFNPFSGG